MLYLAPYSGLGTRDSPFLPLGVAGSFSSVDLRPDPTVVDGFALVHVPGTISAPGVVAIGLDKQEPLSRAIETELGNRLGLTFDGSNATLGDLVGDLLLRPPSVKPWKALTPTRLSNGARVYQVLLNNQPWFLLPVLAGMTTATDDFNRADENPLAGNWTTPVAVNPLRIVTNQCKGSGISSENYAYWNANTFGNDQFSQLQIIDAQLSLGVTVRGSGASKDYYCVQHWTSGNADLFKYVGGNYTGLSNVALTWSVNNYIRLTATGSSLGVLCDASNPPTTSIASATDTTLASGKVGIYDWNGLSTIDNWSGGDLAVAGDGVGSYRRPPLELRSTNPRTLFMQRNQGYSTGASRFIFKKTLSGIGTKTGSRQSHNS